MTQCERCGATLAEGAKFCMQCGAAAPPPPQTPGEPPKKLDFFQPALAGGMALGLLSSIPFVNMGNCFCCMWVLGGGALAAYMLIQQRPAGITYGDGAFGGVLSGLVGAVVYTIISIPMRLAMANVMQSQREYFDQIFRDVPAGPMHDLTNRLFSSEISAVTILATLIPNMVIYSLFAMLGGILMVAIMEKKKKGQTLQ